MPDITLRPPSDADIPALVALRRAAEAENGLEPVACAADYAMIWSKPTFDRTRHAVLAEADGTVAGHADLFVRGPDALQFGYVAPDHRGAGIGGRIIDWAIEVSRNEPAVQDLYVSVPARPEALRLLESRPAFAYARTFFTMLNTSPGDLPAPEWPAGVRLVPLAGAALVDAVLEAHAGSFVDHWNYHPIDRGMVETWLTHPDEDPALWFVAMDGDRVAGFSLCHRELAPSGPRGWVGNLGTGRPWRGIGLGRALLRHSCRTFAERGMSVVGLNVDAASPTGALGFYERSGFRTVVEDRRFVMRVRPGSGEPHPGA